MRLIVLDCLYEKGTELRGLRGIGKAVESEAAQRECAQVGAR